MSGSGVQDHVSGQSNKPLSRPPHALTAEQVLDELSSNVATGLNPEEEGRRLGEYGPNELERSKGVQPLKVLAEQIFNAMTLVSPSSTQKIAPRRSPSGGSTDRRKQILALALAASFGIQAWIEGGILAGVIALNIAIGFIQTLQAERTIDSLRTLGSPTTRVFREGQTITIQTADVVPGDIVDLGVGDSVPADIRLTEAVNLEADESLLTGESAPVMKIPGSTFEDDTGPGDRLNVVFSSTTITKGRGRGVVFATGMFTEIGLIASAINSSGKKDEDEGPRSAWASVYKAVFAPVFRWFGEFLGLTVGTPLQKKLSQLFIFLFLFAIVCAIIVLGANKFDTRRDIIIYAITVAVGTIPVSLLLVLTLTMAAGTKKMLERHVIVRNLSSLEALGGVTSKPFLFTHLMPGRSFILQRGGLPSSPSQTSAPTRPEPSLKAA